MPKKVLTLTTKWKRNIGLANKGKIRSFGFRKFLSESQKGKPSPKKGIKYTEEQKAKLNLDGLKLGWGLMKGKHQTEETKRKMVATRLKNGTYRKLTKEERINKKMTAPRGENHPNWKGGITSLNFKIRNSLEYRFWRESVFERDNYRCFDCGARSEKGSPIVLHADHILPFSKFPRLRFDINNGRTLCVDCHKKTDTYLTKSRWCVGIRE